MLTLFGFSIFPNGVQKLNTLGCTAGSLNLDTVLMPSICFTWRNLGFLQFRFCRHRFDNANAQGFSTTAIIHNKDRVLFRGLSNHVASGVVSSHPDTDGGADIWGEAFCVNEVFDNIQPAPPEITNTENPASTGAHCRDWLSDVGMAMSLLLVFFSSSSLPRTKNRSPKQINKATHWMLPCAVSGICDFCTQSIHTIAHTRRALERIPMKAPNKASANIL